MKNSSSENINRMEAGKAKEPIKDDFDESKELIAADVDIIPEKYTDNANSIVKEEVEQLSKNVAIGRKEISYEDDRNVISVIIDAI